MSALLSNAVNDTDKISIFVAECQRMRIPIYPPDVNKSQLKFVPEAIAEAESRVRHGRASGVGGRRAGGTRRRVAAGDPLRTGGDQERRRGGDGGRHRGPWRPKGCYASMEDFCSRLDGRVVNKKILESLVRCGAMDFTGRDRAEMFSQIDTVMASAASAHRDRASGQFSMFDDLAAPAVAPVQRAFNVVDAVDRVREARLGKRTARLLRHRPPAQPDPAHPQQRQIHADQLLGTLENRTNFFAAGSLTEVSRKYTKKDGKPFAIVILEDLSGHMEAMVWNDVFNKSSKLLEPGQLVVINGRVDHRGEEMRIVVNEVMPLRISEDPRERPAHARAFPDGDVAAGRPRASCATSWRRRRGIVRWNWNSSARMDSRLVMQAGRVAPRQAHAGTRSAPGGSPGVGGCR